MTEKEIENVIEDICELISCHLNDDCEKCPITKLKELLKDRKP